MSELGHVAEGLGAHGSGTLGVLHDERHLAEEGARRQLRQWLAALQDLGATLMDQEYLATFFTFFNLGGSKGVFSEVDQDISRCYTHARDICVRDICARERYLCGSLSRARLSIEYVP